VKTNLKDAQSEHLRIELPKEMFQFELGTPGHQARPIELRYDSLGDMSMIVVGDGHTANGGTKAYVGFVAVILLGDLGCGLVQFKMENIGFVRENIDVHRGTVPFELLVW
jgi:hypothetical protein